MGLDSLPPDTNWVPIPNGRTTPDSVTRSRSVNFMDYLLEFDSSQSQRHNHHRRVRTSVSFREVPTLLTHQNHHDFSLLYLDNIEKSKKTESKQRKCEVGIEEIKQRKKEVKITKRVINNNIAEEANKNQRNNLKISKLKNEPRKQMVSNKQFSRFGSCKGAQVSSGFVSPHKKYHRSSSKKKSPVKLMNNRREVLVESKFMRRIKKHALKDSRYSECSSEDSSPVSVLDFDEIPILDKTPLSDGTSHPQDSIPEKKCSQKPSNLDYYPFPDPSRLLKASDDDDTNKYYIEIVRELYKLTEKDIKESSWVSKNLVELESFEDIRLDFGQHILDLLVNQLVEELAGFPV